MTYRPNIITPHYRHVSQADKRRDKWTGTNFVGEADAYNRVQDQLAANHNQYEYQKANLSNQYIAAQAINQNKYSWNVQGMTKAGINPLAASGSISSFSGSPGMTGAQGQSTGGMSQGDVGQFTDLLFNGIKDVLHEVSPASILRGVKALL